MPTEDTTTSPTGPDVNKLLSALEVPFSSDQVRWRVTNTTSDKKRGQIVPYADSRAYTDRLNALFTPQGWTREYKVETMSNITRVKKSESIVSGKVLVTCTVTVLGIGSHSGTGEEWADDDNGMTSADAQAFKRACSCFGLGRYFYDIPAVWVDLDQNRQPLRTPALSAWALPENWRKGMRPSGKSGNGKGNPTNQGIGSSGGSNGNHGQATKSQTRPTDGGRNGHAQTAKSNSSAAAGSGDDLDARILGLEKAVGTALFRGILRKYGRANQPKLIRDAAIKQKVLQMLESATRGLDRLEAVTQRLDPNTVKGLLDKLQVPAAERDRGHQNPAKRCPRTRRTCWSNPATRSLKKHTSTFEGTMRNAGRLKLACYPCQSTRPGTSVRCWSRQRRFDSGCSPLGGCRSIASLPTQRNTCRATVAIRRGQPRNVSRATKPP